MAHAMLVLALLALMCVMAAPAHAGRAMLNNDDKNCTACNDCAKCIGIKTNPADGTKSFIISAIDCKGTAISWLACMGSNAGACTIVNKIGVSPCGKIEGNKCETATLATWKVAGTATTATFQLHDGQFSGDFACGEKGKNYRCAGGDGGSCPTATTAVCQTEIDLSTCPNIDGGTTPTTCTINSDCGDFDGECAVGKCNTTSGQCMQVAAAIDTPCSLAKSASGGALSCDVPDVCDGTSLECPETYADSSVMCRASKTGSSCDEPEYCTGTSDTCPEDVFKANTTVCHTSKGACDPAETCPGDGPDCPSDEKHPATYTCRAAPGACDVEEKCDGTSDTCPEDGFKANTTECRSSKGDCDPAEMCPGDGPACPADVLEGPEVVCRGSAGACDPAEMCPGNSPTCPADVLQNSTFVCRTSAGPCDPAETCPGDGPDCGTDKKHPSTYTCRGAANKCDVAEMCDGTSDACPVDQAKTQGYTVKCATTIYMCAIPYSLPKVVNGNSFSLGGCTLGTANKRESMLALSQLPWPACMNQCIKSPCEDNQRGVSNMVFYDCVPSSGNWACNSKVETKTENPPPYCHNDLIPNWAPVPV
ncbi:MAG: hypothetical protein J3K34DRAFT_216437 [Monoraphidium minutum]|nr:MAG: hypothetical protein J3K34DRAFT_216437 [Monoraphidium minutum]